jgi:hypothetical protein
MSLLGSYTIPGESEILFEADARLQVENETYKEFAAVLTV